MTLRFSHYLLSAVAAVLFVLCFHSSPAYAILDEYDFVDEEIRIQYETTVAQEGNPTTYTVGPYSGNTTTQLKTYLVGSTSTTYSFFDVFSIWNETESIVPKDYTMNITFTGLKVQLDLSPIDPSKIALPSVVIYDGNGKSSMAPDASVAFSKDENGNICIDLNLPAVKIDVYRIDIQFAYALDAFGLSVSDLGVMGKPAVFGFQNWLCNWSFQEPESAIMKDLVKKVEELPEKIWEFFEGGLKDMFVPGEEDLVVYKSKWEQLLEDHLGVIYQAGDVIGRYVEAFEYSEKSTITVPPVKLHFGNTEWTFGGWEVQIVPPGFDVLYQILRVITAFLATALFVNAMKSRFERLVGGDSNA